MRKNNRNRLTTRIALAAMCMALLGSVLQAAEVVGDGYKLFGVSWGDNTGLSYSFVPAGTSHGPVSTCPAGTTTSLSAGGFATVDVVGEAANAFKSWSGAINAIPGQSVNFTSVADSGAASETDTEAQALAGTVGMFRIFAANLSAKFAGSPAGIGYFGWGAGPSYSAVSGDIYLNNAAAWNDDVFYQVLTHEIGHGLGFGHPNLAPLTVGQYDTLVMDTDVDFLARQGQPSTYRGGATGAGIFTSWDLDGVSTLFAPGSLPAILPPGGGFGAGGASPEPASVTFLTMLLVGGACWRRRKQGEDDPSAL